MPLKAVLLLCAMSIIVSVAIGSISGGIVSYQLSPDGGYETSASEAIPGQLEFQRVGGVSISVSGPIVSLSWSAVAGAQYYKVYSASSPD